MDFFIDFVNFVKYKSIMNSNDNKNKTNKHQFTQAEDHNNNKQSGVYMRDDHCDWGSSGMNEFTNEYSEN
ncbi:MAG: hypothetical protein CBE06_000780 [Pelagibacteraceae bacterium TMED246]|nr:MAG: hypothetical protein CBE06_000780 [Pelagibacteraceae bacterium TMED246]